MILTSEQPLHIHTMGRAFRVRAVFDTTETANAYLESHPGHGVIAVYGSLIFIASNDDPGIGLTKVI